MPPRSQWRGKFDSRSLLDGMGRIVGHLFSTALGFSKVRDCLSSNSKDQFSPSDVPEKETFQHFLEHERKRSERSGRVSRIILIYRSDAQGEIVAMSRPIAEAVIAALSNGLRETDYIGWYRDEQIVGALLTTSGSDSGLDGCNGLQTRIETILRAALVPEEFSFLQIRLYRHDEISEVELT